MHKHLLILRHAKSSHAEPGVADHDRPLNDRGRRDAPRVGELLVEHGLIPDQIISSTATRARETTHLLSSALQPTPPIDFRQELYLAPPSKYLRILAELENSFQTVLMVGHNPGLEAWVEMLSGETHSFPTAALAHFKLTIDSWSELSSKTEGKLKLVWRPKESD